jgi:hypothetical protein
MTISGKSIHVLFENSILQLLLLKFFVCKFNYKPIGKNADLGKVNWTALRPTDTTFAEMGMSFKIFITVDLSFYERCCIVLIFNGQERVIYCSGMII